MTAAVNELIKFVKKVLLQKEKWLGLSVCWIPVKANSFKYWIPIPDIEKQCPAGWVVSTYCWKQALPAGWRVSLSWHTPKRLFLLWPGRKRIFLKSCRSIKDSNKTSYLLCYSRWTIYNWRDSNQTLFYIGPQMRTYYAVIPIILISYGLCDYIEYDSAVT